MKEIEIKPKLPPVQQHKMEFTLIVYENTQLKQEIKNPSNVVINSNLEKTEKVTKTKNNNKKN